MPRFFKGVRVFLEWILSSPGVESQDAGRCAYGAKYLYKQFFGVN